MAVDDSVLMDAILSMDAYNRGDSAGLANTVQWLKAGPFEAREAKVVVRDANAVARIETIEKMVRPTSANGEAK